MQARCHESVVAAVYIHISKRVFVFVCTKRGPKVMKELFKSSYILVLESFVFFLVNVFCLKELQMYKLMFLYVFSCVNAVESLPMCIETPFSLLTGVYYLNCVAFH